MDRLEESVTPKARDEETKKQRRTEDQRIADLERRIADLKARKTQRDRRDDPLLREIPKIQKRLRSFAQMAMDARRPDIANSSTAFSASLERILRSELGDADARETAEVEEEP